MNSLPDIEEVKDKSINKGSSAVRVYRMLPPLTKDQKKGERTASSWHQAGPTPLRQGYNRPGITDLLVAPGLLAKKKKKLIQAVPWIPGSLKMPNGIAQGRARLCCQLSRQLRAVGARVRVSRAAFLTSVLFLLNRKEVKVFKRSKKQEQEKGMCL